MSALEQRLQALGRELAYPPEPELAPDVIARLDRAPFPWRRAAALALAVLAVALAAALAVPQARTALLRWFHIRGATVELVETLPQAQERSKAGGLGPAFPRREAERMLGFHLALPPLDGHPPVHVLGNVLATVLLRADGHPALLSEFRAVRYDVLKKSAVGKSVIEPVRVNGEGGLWVEGPPHTLTYFDERGEFRQRTVLIHGNVLLWTRGELTLRLEGRLSKAQALRIARTIR